jgi:hypothetical protein
MLYLEIQRGRMGMPAFSEDFRELGATTSCTLRAARHMSNNGQKQDDHCTNIFYGDSWFASVKTAEAIKDLGHELCGPVKTNYSLFPKDELERILQEWPGGTSLVLESTTPAKGVKLLAIGYKYNSRKVLNFVATKNAGPTTPGTPYRARFVDDYENLRSRPVVRPAILSSYFMNCNAVDKHNQARQAELKLEKYWKTHNVWFRLVTTIIGVVVTDAWKGYKYAFKGSKRERETSLKDFADQLAFELCTNIFSKTTDNEMPQEISPLVAQAVADKPSVEGPALRRGLEIFPPVENVIIETDNFGVGVPFLTSPLTSTDGDQSKTRLEADVLWAQMISLHPHIQSKETEKTGRLMRRRCTQCQMKTGWYCELCKVFCCPEHRDGTNPRNCYKEHILKKNAKIPATKKK